MIHRLLPLLALALAACGGEASLDAGTDASTTDASTTDAATMDASAVDASITDAGSDAATTDAGATDAATTDAGLTDAGADAATSDAGTCDPDAVRFVFLARGPLEVGTLCDEVYVCVGDAAEAARVMAASSRFTCSATPEAPCTGMTCAYRDPAGPSVLDATELEAICAVTLVSPTPDLVCAVYGG